VPTITKRLPCAIAALGNPLGMRLAAFTTSVMVCAAADAAIATDKIQIDCQYFFIIDSKTLRTRAQVE
jgi:hypothetical protein